MKGYNTSNGYMGYVEGNEDSRQCAFRRKSAEGCTWKMVDDGTENSSSG